MAEKRQQESGIEERIELSMLYDFYGALLKENMQQIFGSYILDDFSISEIADNTGITRQGVHDSIKRATKQLREYEEKLGLAERFRRQQQAVKQLRENLNALDIDHSSAKWQGIVRILEDILQEVCK